MLPVPDLAASAPPSQQGARSHAGGHVAAPSARLQIICRSVPPATPMKDEEFLLGKPCFGIRPASMLQVAVKAPVASKA